MTASVQVQIEEAFAASVSPKWLNVAARTTLEMEGRPTGELTLVITDNETVRALNHAYMGINTPTDVLSFGGDSPDFVGPPGAEVYLGDVLIAYPTAEAQALAAGHAIEEELALLIVHGILHLLGYDHVRPEDKAVMWERQASILSRLGLAHVQPA